MGIWSEARRGKPHSSAGTDHRTPFEHDHDRLLFSTPVRRLSDKTQVWPLDRNDGVRTRLTHSHEVSNLAKSMGKRIVKSGVDFGVDGNDVVLPILSAIGLAHDLGNPPFGHQGEAAIGRWFDKNVDWIFSKFGPNSASCAEDCVPDEVPEELHPEFLEFEGNAQTIRLVSTLQTSPGHFGLDLTAATLASLMKYTVGCDQRKKKTDPSFNCSLKKYGYFFSEKGVVDWLRAETDLKSGCRHPVTWIMEAADDIAYSVLDIEDGIKKRVFSPDDVLTDFGSKLGTIYPEILAGLQEKFEIVTNSNRSIHDKREIKASYIRTFFIGALINDAVENFISDSDNIFSYKRKHGILDENQLCKYLKKFAFTYVFRSRAVLGVENEGAIYIDKLMDFFWHAITCREDFGDLESGRMNAKAAFGFSLISDNYVQAACNSLQDSNVRYSELRLLTDMVSGMTDGFARNLYQDLNTSGHLN